MIIRGQLTAMDEKYVVMHTDQSNLNLDNFTEEEKEVITHCEWLSYTDILNHKEPIFPVILKTHLPRIIAGDYPTTPLAVDLGLVPD